MARRKRVAGGTPGDRLRILRTEAGLTQAEMGEKLGKSQVGFSHYETGEATIPFERAADFARALGMLDERGHPEPEVFLQAVGLIDWTPEKRSAKERLQDWFSGTMAARSGGMIAGPQRGVMLAYQK